MVNKRLRVILRERRSRKIYFSWAQRRTSRVAIPIYYVAVRRIPRGSVTKWRPAFEVDDVLEDRVSATQFPKFIENFGAVSPLPRNKTNLITRRLSPPSCELIAVYNVVIPRSSNFFALIDVRTCLPARHAKKHDNNFIIRISGRRNLATLTAARVRFQRRPNNCEML